MSPNIRIVQSLESLTARTLEMPQTHEEPRNLHNEDVWGSRQESL